jgi:cyclopropane fatty-acyl-phospholipid synthase-like methyltransferase
MTSVKTDISQDWWKNFFRDFRPIFDNVPASTSTAQARYLIRKLQLKAGDRFLDCPCGIGRLSLPLARRGIRVTGVDLECTYLEELAQVARRRKLHLKLVHRDIRQVDFKSCFDGVANMWTSFGYFARESDDLLVLKNMFRALKRGGRFLLHVINRDWLLHNFQPRDWYEARELQVLEERRFDYRTSTMYSTWTFVRSQEERSYQTHIRMYSCHELVHFMGRAGFVDIQGFGSMKDEPVSRDSRMLWIVGAKP